MTTRSGHEASTALAPELRVQLREGAPLEAVATAVRACAIGNGVGVERSTKLQVLVEELLREARRREVVAGDEAIDVEVVFDGGTFLVRVLDSRLPLTSREVRQLGSRRLVAMGFADALSTRYRPSEGNLAECSLDLTRADGRTIGDEVIGPDAPDAPDEVADHLAIGPLEAADIPDLIRCVYRCYGYTYCEPAFYDERHIRRLLAAGLMHSVVAKTMEGEVVGHCALTFAPGGLVPEAGRMIVDPRFRGHHLAEQLAAARAWSVWEASTSRLLPDQSLVDHFGEDDFALAFARIECHYFVNRGFLRTDAQLLEDAHRIRQIPGVIVQGRYDVVCPMESAWALHRAWPEAEMIVVPDAGHSVSEPGIARALVAATDRFAART